MSLEQLLERAGQGDSHARGELNRVRGQSEKWQPFDRAAGHDWRRKVDKETCPLFDSRIYLDNSVGVSHGSRASQLEDVVAAPSSRLGIHRGQVGSRSS